MTMGRRASDTAAEYNPEQFERNWRMFYNEWISGPK